MINGYIKSLHMMKDVDLKTILESETIKNTYLNRSYMEDNHNRLMTRMGIRTVCSEELLPELYSWIYSLFTCDTDDYAFQIVQGNIHLFSQFSGAIYDGDRDLDYQDYTNLRMGYTHIKRVLLRLKKWPRVVDETSTLPDRIKVIIRETLEFIGKYLSYVLIAFLETNKEKCIALKEAWDACEMDLPTKEEFAQGLKRVRDDIAKEHFDTVDGLCRKTWKKFKASLAGVNLNCSVGDVTVIDSGPPSLGLPEGGFIQVPDDPWKDKRMYQQEQHGSMETQPGTPIDPPGLVEDPPLEPSLVEDTLTTQKCITLWLKLIPYRDLVNLTILLCCKYKCDKLNCD